ncbi:MAG: YkgJ family cysteine cluster protein [Bryobacteraceae bacterium]
MITDLVQIKRLGEKKRPENMRFRVYIKNHSFSDLKLRRIAEGIQEQIDCTECANCCRVATTGITDRDFGRLSRYLGITPAAFRSGYTVHDEWDGTILRRHPDGACVFLEGNLCSVYEARPDTCQRFPHLVRGNGSIASRMWQFVDRAEYCPIVYNSMEAFKDFTRFRR